MPSFSTIKFRISASVYGVSIKADAITAGTVNDWLSYRPSQIHITNKPTNPIGQTLLCNVAIPQRQLHAYKTVPCA
ncbi:hypothetical protein B375_0207905 [Xylella fastidiosa 6c]|nr:hypothetical protein ADT30_03355 [Xylella fastidiosa]OJZ70919.1 hypothetical protein B375_0207905 [Xylella fastidiosa 6c]